MSELQGRLVVLMMPWAPWTCKRLVWPRRGTQQRLPVLPQQMVWHASEYLTQTLPQVSPCWVTCRSLLQPSLSYALPSVQFLCVPETLPRPLLKQD